MRDHFEQLSWKFSPRYLCVAVVLILFVFLAACGGGSPGPSSSSSGSKVGGDISVGLNADVVTLDPVKSTALVDRQVMLNLYDTLVKLNAQNQIVPDLASSWTYKSPTQLVFTLRTDVKFQDGTPFNAEAVVFNINRILSDAASPRHSEISDVKSVQAVDASHVQFDLKAPFSPLLATLTDRAGMMLSPAAVKKLGAKLAIAPTSAGSGPFMFSEWVKSDHLTVKRNPDYWQKDSQGNKLPYLQSVRFRPITNGNVEFSNLQTGTINVADTVDPNYVASAKSNPSLVYKQQPGLSFYGIMLNTKVAPLNNEHVRRAIEWATNREEIVTSALKNVGVVANGPFSSASWAYDKDFAPYTHNTDKAKAELTQAGISGTVSFSLLIPGNSPLNSQIAQFFAAQLAKVGITATIKQETFAALLSDTQSHNFQAALLGWSGRPDPDGNIYAWFHTGGGFNDMQYSNSQVDTLLEDARAVSDQTKRTEDYTKAQQLIMQDAPYVFLYHGVNIQATTTNIQNFTLLPTGTLDFSQVHI
ncbi:ABC transporter substrate-binding protein [Ktedonosporobacter rubrisoli]|uniref:ABC transporter substrate-binding protein n=1 Tax=Ktedonosporobacter rubrisoli TaxID=2509675 RepID=A0A4P6JTI6_KTERU|nr:ABC transporter substrate-binding protein [Ktedonosporobacter rubrisoli]QBD78887.1 ABC transporter substrate-binding protein [Ktedonosporobacter rubrisoli]